MKKPIIITGMGHSGTTALARYLATSPGWKLWTNGSQEAVLECEELRHPTTSPEPHESGIPKPFNCATDGSQRARVLEICESEPDTRFVFKRPWLERDPLWCVSEFGFAHFLICIRPFVSVWESWRKPNSVLGCGLEPGGAVEAGWELYSEQLAGAARLICLADAAFVDHGMFCRNPRYADWILTRWGIDGQFDDSVVRASAG